MVEDGFWDITVNISKEKFSELNSKMEVSWSAVLLNYVNDHFL